MSRRGTTDQRGFTIIELLIATAVLSTILLLVTVLMVNIGSLYYKGINQARIQDNVRSISDEVAQQLQLGASFDHKTGAHSEEAYCIGSFRYTYVIGVQIGTPAPGSSAPSYPHVLWRDDNPSPGTCSIVGANEVNLTASNPSTGLHGTELIAPHSRLSNFSVQTATGGKPPYALSISEAYGDDDLLCSPSVANSCTSSSAMTRYSDFTNGNLLCKGNIGSQFCATANLSTSVVKRLL
jgi:prepilin-type N-terminal cleavage/methylation domain-containing protein